MDGRLREPPDMRLAARCEVTPYPVPSCWLLACCDSGQDSCGRRTDLLGWALSVFPDITVFMVAVDRLDAKLAGFNPPDTENARGKKKTH